MRSVRDLCETAVEAALAEGASYADARAVVRRSQSVRTKNGRVEDVNDVESEGIGVRVLVGGAWGFACDRRLDETGAREAAGRAAAFASASPGNHDRGLAPVEPHSGSYRTPVERDPFDVSLSDKVELCLRAGTALEHADVKVAQASVRAQREHKTLVSSEGTAVEQELVETGGGTIAERTEDEVVASIFSLSSAAPHLFGGRLPEFERDLRNLLRAFSPYGHFSERTHAVALDIWRP